MRISDWSSDVCSSDLTHPLSGDRIQALREVYVVDPAWNKPNDPAIEKRFQRVKAKLVGYIAEPTRTLRLYPESDQSVPAHYARAYSWHKGAYPQQALYELPRSEARRVGKAGVRTGRHWGVPS